MSIIAIQSHYTFKHNTLTPYYNALHVSFHQNHNQAPLLQTSKIISTFATCNSFVSEMSLECSICAYVFIWICSRLLNGISVVLDGIPNLYFKYGKHNQIMFWWRGYCTVCILVHIFCTSWHMIYLIRIVFSVAYLLLFNILWHCTTLLLFVFCVLYCALFLYCTCSACDVRAAPYWLYILYVNTATGCKPNCR
jgi:hypothetical protein